MDNIISYVSFAALLLVVVLLLWTLILSYRERSRKITAKGRLSALRKKIDSLSDATDEDKAKKETLYRELILEYLENILGNIEQMRVPVKVKGKKSPKKRKKS